MSLLHKVLRANCLYCKCVRFYGLIAGMKTPGSEQRATNSRPKKPRQVRRDTIAAQSGATPPTGSDNSSRSAARFRSQILTYALPEPGPNDNILSEMVRTMNAQVREQLSGSVPHLAIMAKKVAAATENELFEWLRSEHEVVEAFALDFYSCYTQGSGVLSNELGADLVLQTFRSLAPLFSVLADVEDSLVWQSLPGKFVVYRGGTGPAENLVRGYSWTRSAQIASSFAAEENGLVLTTTVSRRHLLACFAFQEECILDATAFPELQIKQRSMAA